jgi:glycosyltransferase involved in cell wall biosynthesis
MKVLVIATDIYTRGGIARYTATLASTLGHILGPQNVEVLSLLDWGSAEEAPKGFRVVGAVSKSVGLAGKFRFVLRAARLGRRKYDLVFSSHVALAPVAAMIRLLYGTRFWVACHGFESWQRLSPLKLAALKRADLVLPVSQFTAERLWKVNGVAPAKTRVLHNAIPAEFFNLLVSSDGQVGSPPVERGDNRLVLSVGSLSKGDAYKGVDMMIRALPKILVAVPEVQYVVVGGGDNRPNLEKLAAEAGVAGRVTFAGEIPDAQLAALYRACDVFILPSRALEQHGRWTGEGFGRVYLEAALAGKPVIGSRTGGAAEAVLPGQTGLLVDPLSVDEIAEAVVTLLQKPEMAARLGAAGRKWAEANFTQEAMERALAQMLSVAGFEKPLPKA